MNNVVTIDDVRFYVDTTGNMTEIKEIPSFNSVADKIVQEHGFICKEHYQTYLYLNNLVF